MFTALHPIEKLAAIILAIAVALSLGFASTSFSLGLGVGGILSLINFYFLRNLMRLLMTTQHPPKQAMLGLVLMLKFAAMGALIFLAINYLPLAPSGMLLGVSVIVLSILIEGFKMAMTQTATPSKEQDVNNG